ncbi:hypothetical protein KGM48_03710 [Patescibacteria group bacterium]|nr:hypothetical protein [Patescibacteria group bacterium]
MEQRWSLSLIGIILFPVIVMIPGIAHAGIPFLGPIIPPDSNICPASWGMLITVINNIISLLITLAIVFVAPIMIAYSGFLFVVNPPHPEGIEKAREILWNTVKGIVLALSGYLIVSAVMAVLYHPDPSTNWTTNWANIITGNSNDMCLIQAGSTPGSSLNPSVAGSGNTGVLPGGGYFSTALSNSPGSPCNPATLTAVGASQTQANLLACVAQGESTCGATNPPYNLNFSWNKATSNGKASTAAGAYQVLLSSNHACYENATCYSAAGVSGPLNCQNAFDSNGFPIAGALLTTCEQAAGNVQCSAAAAVCLLNQQSFQSAYATDPYMSACQNQYGG